MDKRPHLNHSVKQPPYLYQLKLVFGNQFVLVLMLLKVENQTKDTKTIKNILVKREAQIRWGGGGVKIRTYGIF